jgi:hypothetical protein
VVGYPPLVCPGFILKFVAQGNVSRPKTCSSSGTCKTRSWAKKARTGTETASVMESPHVQSLPNCKNELTIRCDIPVVGGASSDPENNAGRISNPKSLPVIFGSGDRGYITQEGDLVRTPKLTARESEKRNRAMDR